MCTRPLGVAGKLVFENIGTLENGWKGRHRSGGNPRWPTGILSHVTRDAMVFKECFAFPGLWLRMVRRCEVARSVVLIETAEPRMEDVVSSRPEDTSRFNATTTR